MGGTVALLDIYYYIVSLQDHATQLINAKDDEFATGVRALETEVHDGPINCYFVVHRNKIHEFLVCLLSYCMSHEKRGAMLKHS